MKSELLFLSDADVAAAAVPMERIVEAMEAAYLAKARGGVEMPPKPGVHPTKDAHLHAMPALIADARAVGMKWVGAFPGNCTLGLPTISGLIVVNDYETGLPLAVMDCRWITAKRTGAKSAVAARRLARPDSSSLAIVGCGVQGRSNLEALTGVLPIHTVHAYDVDRAAAVRFAAGTACSQFEVKVVETPESAVRESDVVVTSGPIRVQPSPTIPEAWLKPGVFCAPVDFDSYFTGGAMRAMDLFATDDLAQFEYYRSLGYFKEAPPPERVVDLGALVAVGSPARTDMRQRTMAMNLGSGMDDVAVAPLVLEAAKAKGLGVKLEL